MQHRASEDPLAARVSAVVVHYRTPAETLQAVRALQASAPEVEVVVVDNASHDGIAERIAREAGTVRVVALPENLGYGAACNRGARETSRPYLLLLNSDAFVRPGAVEALAGALDSDPGAAAAGPRLLDGDGTPQPSIRRLPTPWRIFCESSGLAFLAGGRGVLAGHSAVRDDHGRPHAVEALMGAALLVRRSAFEEAGGFDEGFFLYAEETDLMARWRERGRRVLFEPRAEVVHAGGASGGDRLFGQLHASLVRYVRKHHGRAAALFARVALDAGAMLRYVAALFTRGRRGRARRERYRAALSGPVRR